MKERIQHVYRMNNYKPKLWERLCLPFFKMNRWRGEDTLMCFKSMFGRMYIYELTYFPSTKYDNTRGVYN